MDTDNVSPKRDYRDIRLTAAQEAALFRLTFHETPVEKELIEQLLALGIVVPTQEGQYELTQFGKGVYVGLVMAREG